MLKADQITYFPSTKNVSASGNVRYFNNDISVTCSKAKYKGLMEILLSSNTKYFRSDRVGAGVSNEVVFKKIKMFFSEMLHTQLAT